MAYREAALHHAVTQGHALQMAAWARQPHIGDARVVGRLQRPKKGVGIQASREAYGPERSNGVEEHDSAYGVDAVAREAAEEGAV